MIFTYHGNLVARNAAIPPIASNKNGNQAKCVVSFFVAITVCVRVTLI